MKVAQNACDIYKIALLRRYNYEEGYIQNNIRKHDLFIQPNNGKIFYDIHTENHCIYVYYGFYGSLRNFSFNNKTSVRRFVQQQLNYVHMDINFLTNEIKFFSQQSRNGNHQYMREWIPELRQQLNAITKRKHELENVLYSPNVSYRAFPIFK